MRPASRSALVLAVLIVPVVLLGLSACRKTNRQQATLSDAIATTPRSVATSEILAHVNGKPISLADFAIEAEAGKHPSKQATLDALVRRQLLVEQALKRGLEQRGPIASLQRNALARRLLEQQFVDSYQERDLPLDLVEKAYALNKRSYQHPELADLIHIVVIANSSEATARHSKAHKLATQLRREAASRSKLSAEDFSELGRSAQQRATGIEINVEAFATPRRGGTVDEFADAAFELTAAGQLSPVVKTRYGYHIIRLNRRIPARDVSLAQAEAQIRKRIFDEGRTVVFDRYLDELRQRFPVKRFEKAMVRAFYSTQ